MIQRGSHHDCDRGVNRAACTCTAHFPICWRGQLRPVRTVRRTTADPAPGQVVTVTAVVTVTEGTVLIGSTGTTRGRLSSSQTRCNPSSRGPCGRRRSGGLRGTPSTASEARKVLATEKVRRRGACRGKELTCVRTGTSMCVTSERSLSLQGGGSIPTAPVPRRPSSGSSITTPRSNGR